LFGSDRRKDHSEARLKMIGREARLEDERKRERGLKRGSELLQKTETKHNLQLLSAEEAVKKHRDRNRMSTKEKLRLRAQDLEDLKRVANGGSEDSLSNFVETYRADHQNKGERDAEKRKIFSDERGAKKEEAVQLDFNPIAAERADKSKAAVKFMHGMVRENKQKVRWGLPSTGKVDMGMMEADVSKEADADPPEENESEVWAQKSKDAYAAAKVLHARASTARKKVNNMHAHPDLVQKADKLQRLRVRTSKLAVQARLEAKTWMEDSLRKDQHEEVRESAFKHSVFALTTRPDVDPRGHIPKSIHIRNGVDPVFEASIFRNDIHDGDKTDLQLVKKLEKEEASDGEPTGNGAEALVTDPDFDQSMGPDGGR